MKSILAGVALSLSVFAANSADVLQTLSVNRGSDPVLTITATFYGMTDKELAVLDARGTKFINTVSTYKKANKGDTSYSITFTESVNGVADPAPTVIKDLSHKDVNNILRANQRYIDGLITDSEAKELKKQKPWGNK